MQDIIFYDIPSTVPGSAWSPNTLKTRITLNYKGIPYKTEWYEYPDIEPLCKKIGAAPTDKKADGRDHYTLPVIYDPNTKKAISDSKNIAVYLEETYPETPALFPKLSTGSAPLVTNASIALYEAFFMQEAGAGMFPFMLYLTCKALNPRSEEYFRRTREQSYGMKMEEFSPAGSEKRAAHWKQVKTGLTKLSIILDENKTSGDYLFGDVMTYADASILGFMWWMKLLVDPKDWEMVASWNDGKWGKFLEVTKKYQVID